MKALRRPLHIQYLWAKTFLSIQSRTTQSKHDKNEQEQRSTNSRGYEHAYTRLAQLLQPA